MSEVKISKREYEKLQRAFRKLDALEAGGVDNWEWYSESLKEFYQEEAFDELVEDFTNSILVVCSEEGEVEYPAGREAGHNILLGDAEDSVRKLLTDFYRKAQNLDE